MIRGPIHSPASSRISITGMGAVLWNTGGKKYGPEEIIVSGGKLIVKVKGEGLELRAMTAEELLITGTVLSVELE